MAGMYAYHGPEGLRKLLGSVVSQQLGYGIEAAG
jgi:hypothetical protein